MSHDRQFAVGDRVVSVNGHFDGVRVVKYARPDQDNEIKVYTRDKQDWFYANQNTLAPEGVVQAVADTAAAAPPAQQLSTEGSTSMSRRTVTVQLIDPDKGLEVSEALVKDFGLVVTEDDDATTIQDLILEHDVAGAISAHNKKRQGLVNLDIKNRTGNEVKLDPVKLKQLKWVIK